MPRLRSRLLVPTLALIALGFLVPALARALPLGDAVLSATEHHEAAPSRLFQLWSLLWAETGSILEPDGSSKPTAAGSGDTGSGLEPDGHP
jgi:hypothetical protein